MSESEATLMGFPEETTAKKPAATKKNKKTKFYSNAVKKDSPIQYTAVSCAKPLLYENDEGSISAWDAGGTCMELHRPIKKLVADGKEIDPSHPQALMSYNSARSVIIEL